MIHNVINITLVTTQQTLAKQLASELDQLTLISCNSFRQKIALESIIKVCTFGTKGFQLFGTTCDTSCHNSETDPEDKFLKFNHYTFKMYFCILCTDFIIVQT